MIDIVLSNAMEQEVEIELLVRHNFIEPIDRKRAHGGDEFRVHISHRGEVREPRLSRGIGHRRPVLIAGECDFTIIAAIECQCVCPLAQTMPAATHKPARR